MVPTKSQLCLRMWMYLYHPAHCCLPHFVAVLICLQDFTADKDPALCNAAACTYNLHSLSCQLAIQAKDRGHTVHFLEDWVERALGCLAGRTRGRVVRDPAHVAASVELDSRAIQAAARSAGVQLGADGTLSGVQARQADISSLLAAPSLAAGCRVLGSAKSFPHAVGGQAAVQWEDIKVRLLPCAWEGHAAVTLRCGRGSQCPAVTRQRKVLAQPHT